MPTVITHLRSNAVAYVALFIALGGTSYAAIKLPANSVGTPQLKSAAVTSPKVKDGSLLAKDFKIGELASGTKGEAGATGGTGPAGPAGATGLTGSPGTNGTNGTNGTDGGQGPPGPSGAAYLSQAVDTSVVPPQLPGDVVRSTTFHVPPGGRVYAFGHARIASYCTAGEIHVRLRVGTVGGSAAPGIPGSDRLGLGDVGYPGVVFNTWGITDVLPTGDYNLLLDATCDGTKAGGMNPSGEYAVGALLLAG